MPCSPPSWWQRQACRVPAAVQTLRLRQQGSAVRLPLPNITARGQLWGCRPGPLPAPSLVGSGLPWGHLHQVPKCPCLPSVLNSGWGVCASETSWDRLFLPYRHFLQSLQRESEAAGDWTRVLRGRLGRGSKTPACSSQLLSAASPSAQPGYSRSGLSGRHLCRERPCHNCSPAPSSCMAVPLLGLGSRHCQLSVCSRTQHTPLLLQFQFYFKLSCQQNPSTWLLGLHKVTTWIKVVL